MKRRAAAGPPKRERTGVPAPAPSNTYLNTDADHYIEAEIIPQRAAQHLARRHLLRLPVALIIAAEIGLGGGS